MTTKSITAKKKRGIYYTPLKATHLLCEWAIRSPKDRILEPSFGGCSFLQSSKERLISIRSKAPGKQLYGCDIDRKAFDHLSEKIGPVDVAGRFLLADFLSLEPSSFQGQKFDVVIGNPPYVAGRDMYKKQKLTADRIAQAASVSLHGRGSLWAYFLVHSLSFMRKDARMAWVLPNSLVQTYYGRALATAVAKYFKKVHIILLTQKLFLDEGTKEGSIVLLADGYCPHPQQGTVKLSRINSLTEFSRCVEEVTTASAEPVSWAFEKDWTTRLLSAAQTAYQRLSADLCPKNLANIADIRIGLVTGNNCFFVLNRQSIKDSGICMAIFRPIYAKLCFSKGLEIEVSDLEVAAKFDHRCLLLSPKRKAKPNTKLSKYLSRYKKMERGKVKTFGKRKVWYSPDDGRDPDAFLSYMCHLAPRLVLNTARTTSTNSIHRVYFKNSAPLYFKKLVAISLLTTYTNLSAEILGRRYGAGLLKLEPSEAGQLPCPIPNVLNRKTITSTFRSIDALLRDGKFEEAQAMADNYIFGGYISRRGINDLTIIRAELARVRTERLDKG